MKKTLLIALFALASTAGFSQRIGLKGGATYYTFAGDDAKDYEYRTGFTAGLMLQQHINELVGVQVEALYTSKGAKIDSRSGSNEITESYRLNYVDVPLLLHLASNGFFVDLGPQASFIAKARQVRELTSGTNTTTSKTDVTDHPYTVDFGYVAGLGYRASNGVGLELRYNGGLKKVYDEGPFVGKDRKNAGFNLMLSYFVGH
ncbi:PorT family protein [Pontibacter sp. E15-1]|uniref:porin family protein n=1 Tax=Pontibacter sp. E15-1 TaxID=2919918 RepID=UPI001F502A46|nr:porin family protein [Pontibacter sp. E15-1]MCJ8167498.1 PorT family protein [Pontibacter sp. E15-1]